MNSTTPQAKHAKKLANILCLKLPNKKLTITKADASAQSGLSLKNSEVALLYLISEYRGNLSITDLGELIFQFPYGFNKPWKKKEKYLILLNKYKKLFSITTKFIIRAWLAITLIIYISIFSLILITISLIKNHNEDKDDKFFNHNILTNTLIRLILDALFWTFHPLSPFKINKNLNKKVTNHKRKQFYEKINNFVFGPEQNTKTHINKKNIIAEIREKKGRIGISDIIRITGSNINNANKIISKLMIDYDGEIKISNYGGIIYEFKELRKTIQNNTTTKQNPIWSNKILIMPFIGNKKIDNIIIIILNIFNLILSYIAIANHWTLKHIYYMISIGILDFSNEFSHSIPFFLGWIPLFFSIMLMIFPLCRFFIRKNNKYNIEFENGHRGLLKAVFANIHSNGINETLLINHFKYFAGRSPSSKELTQAIINIGGKLIITNNGTIKYIFKDIAIEQLELTKERIKSNLNEKNIGNIIFSTNN